MVVGTSVAPLELESIVRAPLVVIADPSVAASGPPATSDDLAGGGAALLERPAGTILVVANPEPDSGLFVWVTRTAVTVIADPDRDVALTPAGKLTVCSGRLVVGAPDVVAAWGADVDTGDGSKARARVHRGRQPLGLIIVCHTPAGHAAVSVGRDAVAVAFPDSTGSPPRLPGQRLQGSPDHVEPWWPGVRPAGFERPAVVGEAQRPAGAVHDRRVFVAGFPAADTTGI